jgi:hypothetical protein
VEGADQPPHDAHVYAVRDEEAYLQADDEKQPAPPEPLDPASIRCQFCGESWEQVPMLFQAKRGPWIPTPRRSWRCGSATSALPGWRRSSPWSPGNSGAPQVADLVLSRPTVRTAPPALEVEPMQEPTASKALAGMPSDVPPTCHIRRTSAVLSGQPRSTR